MPLHVKVRLVVAGPIFFVAGVWSGVLTVMHWLGL